MTAQPVQVLSVLAAAPVYNAAALSDTVAVQPTSRYIIHVKNGGGASITVTLDDQATAGPAQAQAFNPDVQFAVPAAGERVILVDSTRFRDSLGNLNLAFSAITTVTYAIYGPL